MEEENKTVAEQTSPAGSYILPSAPSPPHQLSSHPALLFSAPPRATAAAKKTRRRAHALREMVEMEVVSMDLLDLAPASEYEVYMRSFGGETTRQVDPPTLHM